MVGDFGVSRKLSDQFKAKKGLIDVGSMAYMAPERVLADQVESLSVSDVFSLGICALEIASKEYPFKNLDSIFALFNAICLEPIPLTSARVSNDCRGFISKW